MRAACTGEENRRRGHCCPIGNKVKAAWFAGVVIQWDLRETIVPQRRKTGSETIYRPLGASQATEFSTIGSRRRLLDARLRSAAGVIKLHGNGDFYSA